MKKKFRVYAFFQFSSFFALVVLAMSVLLVSMHSYAGIIARGGDTYFSLNTLLGNSFTGRLGGSLGMMVSVFNYLTLIFWINSLVVGLMILRIKDRNLFDSIFLIFVFIPILSNLLALAAQFTLKTYDYTEDNINKKAVAEEQKKIIEEEMSSIIT